MGEASDLLPEADGQRLCNACVEAHQRGIETPSYAEVARSGPDHAPEFEIEVSLGPVAPERG